MKNSEGHSCTLYIRLKEKNWFLKIKIKNSEDASSSQKVFHKIFIAGLCRCCVTVPFFQLNFCETCLGFFLP